MLKKSFLFVFTAIIFFALGFFMSGMLNQSGNVVDNNNGNQSYQAGWDAAKARLDQTGAVSERNSLGIKVESVYGTVEKTDGNTVYVRITPVEPLADPALDERIVTVDAGTEIIKYLPKENSASDTGAGTNQVQDSAEEGASMEAKTMSLSDLMSGTAVVVHADNDIAEAKQFTASQIIIYEN